MIELPKPRISLNTANEVRDNITQRQIKQIQSMFIKLAKEARDKAKQLEGKDNISSVIQRKYLDDLAKELENQLKADFANLKKNIEQDMTQVSESVIDCIKEFESSIGLPISNSWLNVPVDAVEAVASGNLYSGNWTLSSRIWGVQQKAIKDIHAIVSEGIAANKNAYDIAKDLEKYVDPKAKKSWDWAKVYPGTNRKVDYSAQRLARTMVSHAYQFSFVESTKDNPFIVKYKWISSHDKRVCPICKDRDGKLYDKDSLPLDHPNGRCTFVSVFDKDMNEIGNDLAKWVKGKEGDYPKIDEYMKKRFGTEKYEKAVASSKAAGIGQKKKSVKTKVPEFTAQQKKFLGKYGYTVNNIPTANEFVLKADIDDVKSIVSLAANKGMSYEEFYNNYIGKVKYKWKEQLIPEVNVSVSSNIPDKAGWIERFKEQTTELMLEKEKISIAEIGSAGESALRVYTGSSYEEMNGYLRNLAAGMSEAEAKAKSGISEDKIQLVKDAIQGLKNTKLKEPLVLRRGTDLGDLAGLMPGNFEDNKRQLSKKSVQELNTIFSGAIGNYAGFTSTSSIYEKGFSGDVEIIMYAPEGTNASSIMSISRFGTGEGETLLNAGTKVKVLSVENSDGHKGSSIRIYMEIIS